jgi:hypothetical protein
MVAYARSYEGLRAALGWPRWRVVRAVERLRDAGRVYVVKRGAQAVIQRSGHRVASVQWIQAAEALSEVVGGMGDHGWTVMRRGGHQARLVNAAGVTAVAAAYPLGVRTQTIRALARRLAATADCPDMLLVYTGEASAVGRAQWPKTGKPLVVIGVLGGSREGDLGSG